MAFIDELNIHLKAGRGGDGVVRWLHEKGKEFSGPAGGNGGRGGDVYIRAVRDVGLLNRYRHEPEFQAKNGDPGSRNSMTGASGEDFILDLPVGSIVTHKEEMRRYQLVTEGEVIKVLTGGNGGYGNEHFKASTNTKPIESTPGKAGEQGNFYVEIELFADVGLIGFPNAGKSSLLNVLTNAKSKVASYQFTTLEPHLGSMEGYILADIPGLIEGASQGKGLGHKFLRHIKRTKLLAHCISLEQQDIIGAYVTIRKELELYSPELAQKPEIIIFTKTDIFDSNPDSETVKETVQKNISAIRDYVGHATSMVTGKPLVYFAVTVLDDAKAKQLKDDLVKFLRTIQ